MGSKQPTEPPKGTHSMTEPVNGPPPPTPPSGGWARRARVFKFIVKDMQFMRAHTRELYMDPLIAVSLLRVEAQSQEVIDIAMTRDEMSALKLRYGGVVQLTLETLES